MNYVGYPPAAPGTIVIGDTNPVGTIGWFHKVPDSSWLALSGQSLIKAAYTELWGYAQAFLTADQVVNPGLFKDAGANFLLPNFDGLFVRSLGGIAPNASLAVGVKQVDDFKSHTHSMFGPTSNLGASAGGNIPNLAGQTGATGGVETRPVNVALVACIKALRTSLLPTNIAAASPLDMVVETAPDKFVTPLVMKDSPRVAKAWVNFNGTGVIAIRSSMGVASLTDIGVGTYYVNFITPMANANYAALTSGGSTGLRGYFSLLVFNVAYFQISSLNITATGSSTTSNTNDIEFCCAAAFA